METLGNQALETLSQTGSPKSIAPLTNCDAVSMTRGRKLAARLLSNYPDYGKAPAEYILSLSETMALLTTSEIAWVCDVRDGLATVCKYLPTPADIHEFLKARRAKAEQFRPAHTTWKRFTEDHGPWEEETDIERKKRVVQELLGYDPVKQVKAPLRDLVNKEIPKDASELKTPAAPASPELRALIQAQDEYFEALKREYLERKHRRERPYEGKQSSAA